MGLIMTKMAWLILLTMTLMAMPIVPLMMTTETELPMKTHKDGTQMVMECPMVGKHQTV